MPEIDFQKINRLTSIIPDKIVSVMRIHSKSGDFTRHMYSEQFAYGHREILLKYCGIDYSAQIIGNLQHGVLGPNEPIDFRTPRFLGGFKSKFYVYSQSTELKGRDSRFSNVHAIGSPWLYLKKSVNPKPPLDPVKGKKILVMPAHSQTNVWTRENKSQKRLRAQLFKQVIGSSMATVCLHGIDFCDSETRNAFSEVGFDVTCLGLSNLNLPWSQSSNRVRILFDLMQLMQSHTHFVTDEYGTPLFYAINMGLKIALHPEIRDVVEFQLPNPSRQDYFETNAAQDAKDFFSKNMSSALNKFGSANDFEAIANNILGVESVKSPSELREVLDYRLGIYPKSSVEPW